MGMSMAVVRSKMTRGMWSVAGLLLAVALGGWECPMGPSEPRPAMGRVTPAALDFGSVAVGSSLDATFTITNTGEKTLRGSVTEACEHFAVVSGAGSFTLESGQARQVVVRFSPTSPGPKACVVDTGAPACPDVECAGVGIEDAPACSVAPTSLDFGTVTPGQTADRSFTISNVGSGTLAGAVSEACAEYSLVSGGGAYALGAGATRTVTVRFMAPATPGSYPCVVETGTALCSDVTCSAVVPEPDPACLVEPAALDFGEVRPGETADRSFTITNVGGGTLVGAVSETCPEYAVVSGGGLFALGAGASRVVTARFTAPATPGEYVCAVGTGSVLCPAVDCVAVVPEPDPSCSVDPVALDFGLVAPGQVVDRSFTITNTGGGTLRGTVSESCAEYALASGGGPFALGAGASRTVTVRLSAPVTPGSYPCAVETGTALCAGVSCTATVPEPNPACVVSPTSLDFGSVLPGQTVDRAFTVTNVGGGTLSGAVSEACAEYALVSGGGAYALDAGASRTVTVRFTAPATPGSYPCAVETGSVLCSDVSCAATVPEPDPACLVSPTSLNFGSVPSGQSVNRSFTITNVGGGTLSGTVSEACAEYALVSGGGAYALGAGASRTVTVRFTAPVTPGSYPCTVETGSALCADVSCAATVPEPDPACSVSPTSLNFGIVAPGQAANRSFTITNTGGGTLSGEVSENCDGYEILSGGGAYALGAGASRTVTVRFTAPVAPGSYPCTVETGSALCADVSCAATVPEPDPECWVSADTLDFGEARPGETVDRSLTVRNVGGGTLVGVVSEECDDYEILSGGGAYALAAGDSVVVTVRFTAPSMPGSYPCAVETGSALCADVSCAATVPEPDPECWVEPVELDFGEARPGETADRSFTVRNMGGGTLSGVVSEDCDSYEILSGGGAYALTAGDSVVVTVRFTAPETPGEYPCTVETGSALCADVTCTATVPEPDPACWVSADTLDFGEARPGETVDRSFTVRNVGGGTLSGAVSEACDDYEILSGGGAYALAAGDSVVVTVRFTAPETPGSYPCAVETGSALCADVSCTAVALPALETAYLTFRATSDTTWTLDTNLPSEYWTGCALVYDEETRITHEPESACSHEYGLRCGAGPADDAKFWLEGLYLESAVTSVDVTFEALRESAAVFLLTVDTGGGDEDACQLPTHGEEPTVECRAYDGDQRGVVCGDQLVLPGSSNLIRIGADENESQTDAGIFFSAVTLTFNGWLVEPPGRGRVDEGGLPLRRAIGRSTALSGARE